MSNPVTHQATSVGFQSSVGAKTWSITDPAPHAGFDGAYWLNPYAPLNAGDTTPTVVGQGWNRVTLTAPGHETTYVYRNHQYVAGEVETDVPYSAGPYPVPLVSDFATAVGGGPTLSASENFTLWASPQIIEQPHLRPLFLNDHQKLPDLIVDPRSLLQVQQVLAGCGPLLPDRPGLCTPGTDPSLTTATQQCLTFSVNFVNVGTDNFELLADPAPNVAITDSTLVQQVVYSVFAAPQKVPTTGRMKSQGAGSEAEVENFAQFDLRGPIVSGVCDTEATAAACPIASLTGGTVGPSLKDVCLGSNISQFDPVYGPRHASPFANMNCVLAGTSNVGDVGLSAGWAEMYPVGQDCGFLDINNIPPGAYWFEGEVNPADSTGHRAYLESDYTNNISRTTVTIGEASCPCPSPGSADCIVGSGGG